MFDAVKGESKNKSELFARLSAESQADVAGFLAWLPSQGLKRNTINSYKTYICKAILKFAGELEGELTSDERSAVKKFKLYMAD